MKNKFIKQTFVLLFSIVATLLLSSGNSYGQYPVQKNLPSPDGLVVKYKQDTIRVLLLVCDTSDKYNMIIEDDNGKQDTLFYERPPVWWQFGYIVREKIETGDWWINKVTMIGEPGFYHTIKQYLDQNKKPLPKSIIVWMTKEIKN